MFNMFFNETDWKEGWFYFWENFILEIHHCKHDRSGFCVNRRSHTYRFLHILHISPYIFLSIQCRTQTYFCTIDSVWMPKYWAQFFYNEFCKTCQQFIPLASCIKNRGLVSKKPVFKTLKNWIESRSFVIFFRRMIGL